MSKMADRHIQHLETNTHEPNCGECVEDLKAIDWLLAVRKFGLERANQMFPDG